MPRDLERKQPWSKLRLWTAGESIASREAEDPRQLGVELGGNPEPPQYGMLGGYLVSAPLSTAFSSDLDVHVPYLGNVFGQEDVHWGEHLSFGLPLEYRASIYDVAPLLRVTAAAYGEVSSSQATFHRLARMLMAGLALGEWPDDEGVWRTWDKVRDQPFASS